MNRKINHPNSAINQLRKVLQAVHMNQRVVSTTIEFDLPTARIPNLPTVSVDGIELPQDFENPIQKIEVSRVFKYQSNSVGKHSNALTHDREANNSKMQQTVQEWIQTAENNPRIIQLHEKMGGAKLDN